MNPDLTSRFLIALLVSVTGLALYLLVNRLVLQHATGKIRMFKDYQAGRAAIVYFTTPNCAPCRTIQRPAIEAVKNQMGVDLQIIEVDATLQPEIARQWGVMSVPTTFIVDTFGNPRHVNHGVATVEKLNSQLNQLEDFEI